MNVEKEVLNKLDMAFNVDLMDKTRISVDEYDEEELVGVLIKNKFTYWKYKDMKVVDGVKTFKRYIVVFKK